MKVLYSIGKTWSRDDQEYLAAVGVNVREEEFSYIQLEQDLYAKVAERVLLGDPIYAVGAKFDSEDLDNADFLAITGLTEFGYPQPDNSLAYLDLVYDQSILCKSCGIAKRQINPFRINSDKTKLKAFQLTWVHDEIFVKKDFYEELFLPLGIGHKPVLIHRSGDVSGVIVQLDIPSAPWELDMSGVPFELCAVCGRKKYPVRPTDFLPKLSGKPVHKMFRGLEYHGSGAQAYRRIFISQAIRKQFLEERLAKAFQFYPVGKE
jgi:hypothetical protein